MLEELLYHVVAKDVRHQLQGVWLDLIKDHLLLFARRSFQLLLDEARAMLVTAELDGVANNVLGYGIITRNHAMRLSPHHRLP